MGERKCPKHRNGSKGGIRSRALSIGVMYSRCERPRSLWPFIFRQTTRGMHPKFTEPVEEEPWGVFVRTKNMQRHLLMRHKASYITSWLCLSWLHEVDNGQSVVSHVPSLMLSNNIYPSSLSSLPFYCILGCVILFYFIIGIQGNWYWKQRLQEKLITGTNCVFQIMKHYFVIKFLYRVHKPSQTQVLRKNMF